MWSICCSGENESGSAGALKQKSVAGTGIVEVAMRAIWILSHFLSVRRTKWHQYYWIDVHSTAT